MKQHIIFIQVHERPGVIEAQVVEAATLGDLRKAIEAAGVLLDAELHIFLDEAEEPLHGDHGQPIPASGTAPVCTSPAASASRRRCTTLSARRSMSSRPARACGR